MKRRALFSSDSDASDDDIIAPRRATHSSHTRNSNSNVFEDPLHSRAAASASQREREEAGVRDEASFTSKEQHQLELPLSTKVTTTRQNLSQLFSSAPAPAARASSSSSAGAAYNHAVESAIRSTLSTPPSAAAAAASSSRSAGGGDREGVPVVSAGSTGTLFTPSFTYEGPHSTSATHFGGGSSGSTSGRVDSTERIVGGGLPTAVLHAVVQVYRDELSCGTCMLALRVPPSSSSTSGGASSSSSALPLPPSAAARERLRQDQQQQQQQQQQRASPSPAGSVDGPTMVLMSANRQVLCKVPLDNPAGVFGTNSLQLHQDREQPQYLTFLYATPSSSSSSSSGGGISGGVAESRSAAATAACWWTCMFADRDKASEFLVSTYTLAQYAAALAKQAGTLTAPVPTVRVLPTSTTASCDDPIMRSAFSKRADEEEDDAEANSVQRGVLATLFWSTWSLRRVSRTTPYCLPSECVERVSAGAPLDIVPGAGAVRDGLDSAVVGMRAGESRLVFLSAKETRARHPELCATPTRSSSSAQQQHQQYHQQQQQRQEEEGRRRRQPSSPAEDQMSPSVARELDRPAVVYVTCVRAVSKRTPAAAAAGALVAAPAAPASVSSPVVAAAASAPASSEVAGAALLQQLLLLNTLQQQQQQQQQSGLPNVFSSTASATPNAAPHWDSVERSLDRVMLQLGSLYEKVDRLDIEGKLQRNNAELEQAMKRVVGLAPQDTVAVEDTMKDRDALLASVERYRRQYEEANTNYQRALEAMGRSADKVRALEKDAQVQQELWARQRSEAAEQVRLRLLEKDVRHREELENVAETRYAAGKADGHAQGYRDGRQAAITAVDGEGGVTAVTAAWKTKVMTRDQQIVSLQAALQDAKYQHERDRRQLRAEIDVLTDLNEKLQHMQANADVRMPEETVQQQCKRIKRTLNTVYTKVEAELLALPQHGNAETHTTSSGGGGALVAVDDALAVVMAAIRAEAQAAVAQIKAEGEERARQNAAVRDLTAARLHGQRPPLMHSSETANSSSNHRHHYFDTPEKAEAKTLGLSAASGGQPTSSLAASIAASSSGSRPAPPPPPPPERTAASRSALVAVEASLLPEMTHLFADTRDAATADAGSTTVADGSLADSFDPALPHFENGVQREVRERTETESSARAAEAVRPSATSLSDVSARDTTWSSPGVAETKEAGERDKVRDTIGGSSDDDSYWRSTKAVEARCGSTAGVPGNFSEGDGSGAAQGDVPDELSSPSAPASPAPSDDASPSSTKPSRQATRLPDLPPALPAPPPPPSLPSVPHQEIADGSPVGGVTATSAASPLSAAVEETPSLRHWQGSRLFTTPASSTKPATDAD